MSTVYNEQILRIKLLVVSGTQCTWKWKFFQVSYKFIIAHLIHGSRERFIAMILFIVLKDFWYENW